MLFELFPDLWIGPILATLSWTLLVALSAWVLVFKTPIFNRYIEFKIDAAFCTMLNIIFVFFMAFMGSDFHENFQSAQLALVKEKAALNRLLHAPLPAQLSQQTKVEVSHYLENVINTEWRKNLNRQESPAVQNALIALSQILVNNQANCASATTGNCVNDFIASAYFRSIDELREARDYRLAIGALERQTLRYLLCIFLAFNAVVSILILFRANRKGAIIPLVMYGASIWIAFMIVVLHAEPYVGVRGIAPIALEHLLDSIKTN